MTLTPILRFRVLHAFGGSQGGLYGSLALDQAGNLYGTERGGGAYGAGAAFELTPDKQGLWVKTVLHSFDCNDNEGCAPQTGLVFDAVGNLYGMTTTGGAEFGSVFELKPNSRGWDVNVLHDLGGRGATPLLDDVGNLYAPLGQGEYGLGAVDELVRSKGWKEASLYSFCPKRPCVDGWSPFAGVTWGSAGSLYGTTQYGGDSRYCGNTGCGVVYQLTPDETGSWKETVLHSFPAFKGDGLILYSGVVLDKSGNVYGSTYQGGSIDCGVIFKLTPKANGTWEETILHDFTKLSEGCSANTLTFDAKGNLWGTAQGGTGCKDGGCGVVFEMTQGPRANGITAWYTTSMTAMAPFPPLP